jgi:chromosome segregation protein
MKNRIYAYLKNPKSRLKFTRQTLDQPYKITPRMFLKSLEMVGFKSFAERTIVEFHKGMTAIVGPNGCGKSNVLDSIRWVLGEQSAKALRGGSMQDIIFGGTDGRKPLALAEVSLTFSDCEKELGTDYNEVRITRRVFRDGQSEYEINKTPCRLRDIHQLFMDTGIGRTAYSIMEQGKIDAILSSKPEDRRAVFEEAAGITRFKSQKKEALRKLELTESNLLRVTDIIKEVSRQIGSLQRQAAKARRYKEISEKLKELDTKLAVHHFHGLQAGAQEAEKIISEVQTQISDIQKIIEEKDSGLRQKRIDLENLEDQLRHREQQKAQADYQKGHAQQEIQFHSQRIQEHEGLMERRRIDIASAEEKLRVQQEQAKALHQDLEAVAHELEKARQQLTEQQNAWQQAKDAAVACAKDRERLEAEVLANNRQLETHRARLVSLETEHGTHQLRMERILEDARINQENRKQSEAEINAASEQIGQHQQQFEASEKSVNEIQAKLEAARNELRQRRSEFEDIDREKTHEIAKQQALQQLIASGADYSETTRRILQKHQGQGVLGTLLSQIQVEAGYERAIETVLGRACETLLTENPDTFYTVISEIQENEAAVIAPAQILNIVNASTELHPQAALRFVKTSESIRGWISKLLENVFIVENEDAVRQLKETQPQATIVTLQGEMWHRDGWQLRGRGTRQHASVLARQNELKKLEQRVEELNGLLSAARTVMDSSAIAVQHAEAELAEAEQQRQKLANEGFEIRYRLDLLKKRGEELQGQARQLEQERVRLSDQHNLGIEEQKRLIEQINQIAEANQKHSVELEALGARWLTHNRESEEKGQSLMDTRVLVAAVEQKRDNLERQRGPLEARAQELQQHLRQYQQDLQDYEGRIGQSKQIIAQSESLIQEVSKQAEQFEQEILTIRQQRQELQNVVGQMEQELRGDRSKLTDAQERKSREEVVLAEKRMYLNNLNERIQRTYHVQIEDVARERHQVTEGENAEAAPDWQQIEVEVNTLREKIDNMGPVNVEAITEYEELEQRHTFLLNQEKDLHTSKEQLIEAIKKINETTKVMFAETFQKIQENFSKIFVELFGGGRASLTLVDENDPLESGIEIIAKPPGKQLQGISLLSGGEKTMTAVAMLFAIYMVKPSPFCVLDEMDAPLDESNIGRFVTMLQRFLQQSQFIVITHNKRTISAADVLYGVTMQEHGVSKIISAKLSRRDEDPLFAKGKKEDVREAVNEVEVVENEKASEDAMESAS